MKLSEILANPIKLKGGGNLDLKGLSKVIVDKEVGGGDEFPYGYIVYPDMHIIYNPEDWDDEGQDEEHFWQLEKSIIIPNIKSKEPYKLFAIGNISYKEQTDSSYLNNSSNVNKNFFSFNNIINTDCPFNVGFYERGLSLYIEDGDIKPTSPLYINISKLIAIKADV